MCYVASIVEESNTRLKEVRKKEKKTKFNRQIKYMSVVVTIVT